MWNNQKNKTKRLFAFVSNLQTYYHFKLDFKKKKWTNIQEASG